MTGNDVFRLSGSGIRNDLQSVAVPTTTAVPIVARRLREGDIVLNDMARIFAHWPAAIPRSGTVVTAFGESIPFNEYLLTNELVLLLRPQPDAQGTRRVIMKLADIVAIRIAEAVDPARFTAMGFQMNTAAVAAR